MNKYGSKLQNHPSQLKWDFSICLLPIQYVGLAVVWYLRVGPVWGTGTSIVFRPSPSYFYFGSSKNKLMVIRALLNILAAHLGFIFGLLAMNAFSWPSSKVVHCNQCTCHVTILFVGPPQAQQQQYLLLLLVRQLQSQVVFVSLHLFCNICFFAKAWQSYLQDVELCHYLIISLITLPQCNLMPFWHLSLAWCIPSVISSSSCLTLSAS